MAANSYWSAAAAGTDFNPLVAQEARELDAHVALVSVGLGVTLVPEGAARPPCPEVAFRPAAAVCTNEAITFRLVALWCARPTPALLRTFVSGAARADRR